MVPILSTDRQLGGQVKVDQYIKGRRRLIIPEYVCDRPGLSALSHVIFQQLFDITIVSMLDGGKPSLRELSQWLETYR